jgi:type III secretory pathway component EscS
MIAVQALEGIGKMHSEVILIAVCAVMLVCFWRAALAILVSTVVGVLLLGLVTALTYFLH